MTSSAANGRSLGDMSADDIERRISDLARQTADHELRDMDGELQGALAAGADVDALEALQIEADRKARRSRVERQALEAQLPKARLREGVAEMDALRPEYKALTQDASSAADDVAAAWERFNSALTRWAAAQVPAVEISKKAAEIAKRSGAPISSFGPFVSARLSLIAKDLEREEDRLVARLNSGARGFNGMAQQVDGVAS